MNPDFRNRILLPIVLPLAVLLGVVVIVGGIALILLFNTREVGLAIAVVVASGFMVAFSLANGVDEEDMTLARRGVIVAVGVVPLLAGAGISLWSLNGGVPLEEIRFYVEPVALAPEGALIGAQNSESFCTFEDPDDEGSCTDTSEVTFPAQPDAETFAFVFNNLEAGVPHNAQLFELAGSADAPEAGEVIFGTDEGSEIITGPAEIVYEVPVEDPALFEEGAQFYYNCAVHPVMEGVLTIGPPPGEGDEG